MTLNAYDGNQQVDTSMPAYSEELKGSFCQELEQKKKLKFKPKVHVQEIPLVGKKVKTNSKGGVNAQVALGLAIAVYLEMLTVGIAVVACCLVAAAVICYCNKPLDSLENSNAEAVANRVQEVDQ